MDIIFWGQQCVFMYVVYTHLEVLKECDENVRRVANSWGSPLSWRMLWVNLGVASGVALISLLLIVRNPVIAIRCIIKKVLFVAWVWVCHHPWRDAICWLLKYRRCLYIPSIHLICIIESMISRLNSKLDIEVSKFWILKSRDHCGDGKKTHYIRTQRYHLTFKGIDQWK